MMAKTANRAVPKLVVSVIHQLCVTGEWLGVEPIFRRNVSLGK
jgi:hypothetical protein